MVTGLDTGPCTTHRSVGAEGDPLGGSWAGSVESVEGSRSRSQLRGPRTADVGSSMLNWFESK